MARNSLPACISHRCMFLRLPMHLPVNGETIISDLRSLFLSCIQANAWCCAVQVCRFIPALYAVLFITVCTYVHMNILNVFILSKRSECLALQVQTFVRVTRGRLTELESHLQEHHNGRLIMAWKPLINIAVVLRDPQVWISYTANAGWTRAYAAYAHK